MDAEIIDWNSQIDQYLYGDGGVESKYITSPCTQGGLEWSKQKLKLVPSTFAQQQSAEHHLHGHYR
eukprot:8376186-Pyramimonas_sp.AAC.1